jgi:hypothetical protein
LELLNQALAICRRDHGKSFRQATQISPGPVSGRGAGTADTQSKLCVPRPWNSRWGLLESLMGAIRNMNWTRLMPPFIVLKLLGLAFQVIKMDE